MFDFLWWKHCWRLLWISSSENQSNSWIFVASTSKVGIYLFGRCLFLTINHFLYWGANYEWALDGDFIESTVGDDIGIGTPGVAQCGSASVTCYTITEAQSSLRQENRYLYTHLTATIVNITNVWMLQDYISFHIVSPNSWDLLIVGADMEDGPSEISREKMWPKHSFQGRSLTVFMTIVL